MINYTILKNRLLHQNKQFVKGHARMIPDAALVYPYKKLICINLICIIYIRRHTPVYELPSAMRTLLPARACIPQTADPHCAFDEIRKKKN